ncbi:alpha/beta hydrolase [Lewinellaceae bacterium SD302]|nr:alpha/beta hydrolase [Lewinellaceae bacterium SD302]
MNLNFKTYGQGPPLVILHGLFGTLDNWQTLAKRWADNYTVYLVDQRNHGRSPHLDEMSYPLLAEDLAKFLDKEWIHECHLLGHSMGGKTAMQFALDYPDQVSKLIVVDMAPKIYPAGHDEIFDALRSLKLEELENRRDAATHLNKRIPQPAVVQFLLKNLSRDPGSGFRWKMNLEVLYRDYKNILANVTGPAFPGEALFVRGGKSHYVTVEDLPLIRELFPSAQLATVAEAGHWVHAQAPDELFKLVSDFIEN